MFDLEHPLKPLSRLSLNLQRIMLGPTPITAIALYSLIGALGGSGLGKVLSYLLPEHVRKDASKYYALWGALGAGGIMAFLHALPAIQKSGLMGLFEPSPLQQAGLNSFDKTGQDDSFIGATGAMFAPQIDSLKWQEMVSRDPFIPDSLKYNAGLAPLLAGTQKGSKWVSISDVGRMTSKLGLGYLYGKSLGALAAKVLRLTPETKSKIQQAGILAALLKELE